MAQYAQTSRETVTCWSPLPGTTLCKTEYPMEVGVAWNWVKETGGAYMSGSGAPRGLVFWAAWWAGRDHRQLCNRSARLMAAVKISGDAAALDVLALPQLPAWLSLISLG